VIVLVVYTALVVVPVAAFYGVARVLAARSSRAATRRQREEAQVPANLGRLVDDLRRLETEYVRIERSDLPARAARLRAVALAYDDTLRACCRALGLPDPSERPLSGLARLQTEAELAQRGLVW
jgi:hypothetical protein